MTQFNIREKKCTRALLVGFDKESLDELSGLTTTLGIEVDDFLLMTRRVTQPAYLLTKGRLEKLCHQVQQSRIEAVMMDCELTPTQYRNLEHALKCVVVDRTELILQIFTLHAKSSQAKLQIEIAQLRYLMPRLRRMWTHFSRIQGGIGGRGGLGEQQLEIDRRRIMARIHSLEKKLKVISGRKERELKSRDDCFRVSLMGYTNVGKSTLLNKLTGASALVDDKLFATLDTMTRRLKESDGVPIVLTDTVGLINKLPHSLVASFQATLAEAAQADLLLYVIDASSSQIPLQIETINNVLKELKVEEKAAIFVFNKIDKLKERVMVGRLKERFPDAYFVSAPKGIGLKKLTHAIMHEAQKHTMRVDIILGFQEGQWIDYFKKHCKIIRIKYLARGIQVSGLMSHRVLNHFYENRNE